MTLILEALDIHKTFGAVKAVDGLSLRIAPGECLALLGPNGAGKTTTVEILEGLLKPDKGTIHVMGKSLAQNHRTIMEKVGVMLQETQLYKKMTVRETLGLFASFFQNPLRPDDILADLQLEEKANTRLEHLSGGQKQRCYLGCALINDPQLMFLDEPTTGLDPQARRSIWELLKKTKDRNKSILLTTHYMDEAEYLADQVAIVDHGKIIAHGSPKELIHTHCGEQVVCFSVTPALNIEELRLVDTDFASAMQLTDGDIEVVTTNPVTTIQKLYRLSEQKQVTLNHLEMRRSTLEDVFLKLTGRRIRND